MEEGTLYLRPGVLLDKQDGKWFVHEYVPMSDPRTDVRTDVSVRPHAALLLLEHEPTEQLLQDLAGFPFRPLLTRALKSRSARWIEHALVWICADEKILLDLRAAEIETELEEETGRWSAHRWIAGMPELPGCLVYGDTEEQAVAKVKALAARVVFEEFVEQLTAAAPFCGQHTRHKIRSLIRSLTSNMRPKDASS